MTVMACCAQRCAPVKFVRSTASQSSAFMRTANPSRVIPALLTRMSSRPNFSMAWRKPDFTCSPSATSIATARASPPAAAISATTPANFSALRAAAATRAPACDKAIAVARPIPCDAPVTRATRSFRLNMGFCSTGFSLCGLSHASFNRTQAGACVTLRFRGFGLRLREPLQGRPQGFFILHVEHVYRAVNLPQQPGEDAPGPYLDKGVDALVDQLAHGFFPANRQSDLAD